MKRIIAVAVFLSFFVTSFAITGCTTAAYVTVKALEIKNDSSKGKNKDSSSKSKPKSWNPGTKEWE